MGVEYRLEFSPPPAALDDPCEAVFASSQWQRIATSLIDETDGIGVQCGTAPANSSWPQVADLCVNDDGSVYALCHNTDGTRFLHALIAHLESAGYSVTVDKDYY